MHKEPENKSKQSGVVKIPINPGETAEDAMKKLQAMYPDAKINIDGLPNGASEAAEVEEKEQKKKSRILQKIEDVLFS